MPVSRTSARLKTVTTAAVGLTLFVIQAAGAPAAQSISSTGQVTAQATSASQAATTATPTLSTASAQPSAATTLTPSTATTGTTMAKNATTQASKTAQASQTTRASTSASASASDTPTVRGLATSQKATGTYAGWTADWIDNLNVPMDQTQWGAYGWGYQVPGQGAMGRYLVSNTFISNGIMTLRTQYANGEWSSAGVSSGNFYSAAGGRWEVRAKFPVSKGIQYAFLLYPDDGSWPPEVDIAEGRVNGPENMATYHWGSANNQVQSFMSNPDMSGWHTYGAIIGTNTITYTFDGRPWATISNSNVTTMKLWIGFQCGAMDPNGEAKAYETVDNGVPGPLTPAVSDIQIDWVAHYIKA
jgi:Glycosyl hydrolases family 16